MTLDRETCALCGAPFAVGDLKRVFPHFIRDDAHPLYSFSGMNAHAACFRDWPRAAQFRDAFRQQWPEDHPHQKRALTADGLIVDLEYGCFSLQ